MPDLVSLENQGLIKKVLIIRKIIQKYYEVIAY